MIARTRTAISIWRTRMARTSSDRSYKVYALVMVALVGIAPLARAVWLSAASPAGMALLSSSTAPEALTLSVAAMWAGALLLGRDRGPAILPPFLTYALGTSDLSRTSAFGGPLIRAWLLVTGACTIVATLIGASLAYHGLSNLAGAVGFTVIGVLVGTISTVAWLLGQALPRAAVYLALAIVALGALAVVVPAVQAFTPWGWVGLAYPTSVPSPALAALLSLAVALVSITPVLMNQLSSNELAAQSVRWNSATTHAAGMDLGAAAAAYQSAPHSGRRLRAVRRRRRLTSIFVIRDAIGAIRTPGRLVVGVVALAVAAMLLTFALSPTAPAGLLGAAAGAVAFVAVGPFTDGIRHAAAVAADLPLYGISDERLLASHSLFPLAVVVIVLVTVVVLCSIVTGAAPGAAIVSSLALGTLAVATRITNALKGPFPPVLLTPIPTEMGDAMAPVRAIWALDGVLLAGAAGASSALILQTPLPLLATAVTLGAIGVSRWRHRR